MATLLKAFGKGLLYILVLPVLIVILAVYVALGLVIFIYIGLKTVILFFTGRNLRELPEDIRAREILEGTAEEDSPVENEPQIDAPKQDNVEGFASTYYVPLNQNTPAPSIEPVEPKIEDEGGDKE